VDEAGATSPLPVPVSPCSKTVGSAACPTASKRARKWPTSAETRLNTRPHHSAFPPRAQARNGGEVNGQSMLELRGAQVQLNDDGGVGLVAWSG
jgi:hypothetical protein